MRVLLVEDNPVNHELAAEQLKRLGCSVVSAMDGAQALEALDRAPFDAVLMDCQMPVIDGLEATSRWREREREWSLPRVPIIALTANALQGDREACLRAGMDDYVSKPFTQKRLREALTSARSNTVKTIEPATTRQEPIDSASSAPAATPRSVIDPAALEAIAALDPGGQSGLVTRIVRLFESDSQTQVAQLEQALATGDAKTARRIVHTLKSSGANVGATPLSQVCAAAEVDAANGNLTAVGARLAQIVQLRDAAVAELASYRSEAAA